VKIDTQRYPALASKYGIKALPTLVLFKDGKVVDRLVSGCAFNEW
jgi:thioredoxin 1